MGTDTKIEILPIPNGEESKSAEKEADEKSKEVRN